MKICIISCSYLFSVAFYEHLCHTVIASNQNIDNISGKLKEKLIAEKDKAELSHTLATIKADCDIVFDVQDFEYDFPFNDNVKNMFVKYQFKSLLKRAELFCENKVDEKVNLHKNVKTIEIESVEQLKNILNKKICCFSFNFIKNIEFSINNEEIYTLQAQQTLFSTVTCAVLASQ